MLSFNDFEKHMDTIIKYYKKDDALSEILEVEGFIVYSGELIDRIIELLEIVMDDADEWIQYWCWECEFGNDAEGRVQDKDGNNIPLKTIKDLYFMLLKGRQDESSNN